MGQFVKIGSTKDLETLEPGKLVEAGGQRIAIFNLGGKYYAIEDRCSHRGGPLSEGMLVEDEVNLSVARLPIQRKNRRRPHTARATEREEFPRAHRRK